MALGRLVRQGLGIKEGNGRILGHAVRDHRGCYQTPKS